MASRDEILEKIRKCMALATSANEHEAAAALRQATKLMEMHQVSQAEMLAIGVTEEKAKSGVLSRPSKWEGNLANRIAQVFGCRLIFREGFARSEWVFIGIAPANQVAAYSFDVLYRQACKARREFITSSLKRFKKANKVRRADLYCIGWVQSACAGVAPLTQVEGTAEAIKAFMEVKYTSLEKLEITDRNKGKALSYKDELALGAGYSAGRNAKLHQGVGGGYSPLLLGS